MENMQYGQGNTGTGEPGAERPGSAEHPGPGKLPRPRQQGVVDFTQAKKPEDKSLNYTHKFAKPVEIMGQKYSSLTFYFEN